MENTLPMDWLCLDIKNEVKDHLWLPWLKEIQTELERVKHEKEKWPKSTDARLLRATDYAMNLYSKCYRDLQHTRSSSASSNHGIDAFSPILNQKLLWPMNNDLEQRFMAYTFSLIIFLIFCPFFFPMSPCFLQKQNKQNF